jgi:hypothetical protein
LPGARRYYDTHCAARRRPEQTVVTIEPTTAREVARLMLTAYVTTRREQDVSLELLAGRSTAEIADGSSSPHTQHAIP